MKLTATRTVTPAVIAACWNRLERTSCMGRNLTALPRRFKGDAASCGRLSEPRPRKRLVQIRDQVIRIFEPDVEPQHSLAHSHLVARLGPHVGVSRAGRVRGKR